MDSPFCASSDENVQSNAPAMLAYAGVFDCIFEEHRDNDRTKFWSMSYERGKRKNCIFIRHYQSNSGIILFNMIQ